MEWPNEINPGHTPPGSVEYHKPDKNTFFKFSMIYWNIHEIKTLQNSESTIIISPVVKIMFPFISDSN